jgi:hypothetical protein
MLKIVYIRVFEYKLETLFKSLNKQNFIHLRQQIRRVLTMENLSINYLLRPLFIVQE